MNIPLTHRKQICLLKTYIVILNAAGFESRLTPFSPSRNKQLLYKVKSVPLGEGGGVFGGDGDLGLVAGDGDGVAEGTGLAADLDALLKELLQGGDIHNLILHRLRAVDHERRCLLLPSLLGPNTHCSSFTHLSNTQHDTCIAENDLFEP